MYVDKHTKLLKLIKDSSSQNKESTVTIYFDDFTSPFAPFAPFAPFVSLENTREIVFYRLSEHLANFVKTTRLRVVFSVLFLVFGYPDETLSVVFYILTLSSVSKCVGVQYYHRFWVILNQTAMAREGVFRIAVKR